MAKKKKAKQKKNRPFNLHSGNPITITTKQRREKLKKRRRRVRAKRVFNF